MSGARGRAPRRRRAALAACLAFSLAGASRAAFWPFSEARGPDPLAKAETFFARAAFPETIDLASKALDAPLSARQRARAYWLMGQSYESMGSLDKALSVYQLAVKILPKDKGLLLAMGDLFRRVGLDDRAEPQFRAVLDLEPSNAAAHLGLADILLQQGLFDDARARYAQVLKQKPDDVRASLGMGRSLAGLGRLEEAEAVLGRCAESGRGGAEAWSALSEAQKRDGKLSDAITSLEHALGLDPRRDDWSLRRLFWLLEADRDGDAAGAARAFLQTHPDDALARFALAMAFLRDGDASAGAQELKEAADTAADHGADPFLQRAAAALLARLREPAR